MPPIDAALAVRPDPWALGWALAATFGYLLAVRRATRRGHAWPVRRTVLFLVAGVGGYLAVSLGFPGAFSAVLRWAFVIRVTLLVVLVPALAVLGRPVALARAAWGGRVDAVMGSRPVRVLGSPVVAPLVPLGVFLVLITPVAGWLRTSPTGEALVDVVVPALGLAVAVPLAEPIVVATSTRITFEFLLAFVELLADAIPGILMRLAVTVLDGAVHRAAGAPAWVPQPLRDQQLAGDLLWCIAEAGDIPALILLFVRWTRTDRREARGVDDLSDEEYEALTRAHLDRPRP